MVGLLDQVNRFKTVRNRFKNRFEAVLICQKLFFYVHFEPFLQQHCFVRATDVLEKHIYDIYVA